MSLTYLELWRVKPELLLDSHLFDPEIFHFVPPRGLPRHIEPLWGWPDNYQWRYRGLDGVEIARHEAVQMW